MTQRYCESCGNLFDAKSTAGVTSPGKYLCPSCATKQASKEGDSAAPGGDSVMEKGAGLKKSVDTGASQEAVKLTFRCPGCNALLSSRKIDKRSRLNCPKCGEKVILNPDGTAELLSKPAPHMKKMEIPDKKSFTDQDLERLLDFGETQPITKDSGRAAPTPRPPSGRKTPAPAPPVPAPASSGPQYMSDEDEDRLKFLDQVQGPGGGRVPAAGPKTLDSEVPSPPKQKAPPSRKKLARFGTDRQKSDSVEDRLEAARQKRAATRNNILAVVFIVLPILIGVVVFSVASKKAGSEAEESGFGKLVRNMGARIKPGLIAVGRELLKQEPVKPEEKAPESEKQPEETTPEKSPETPEKPAEQPPVTPEKPAEQPGEPAETPEKPAETPEKPAETPEIPAETPEKPADTPEKPAETPEKPTETPERPVETPEKPAATPEKSADTPEPPPETPEKPTEAPEKSVGTPGKPAENAQKDGIKICPKCGKPAPKDALKCPWCPYEYPPPKKEEEPKKEDEPKKDNGARTQ
jgi:DNA-directed RNA polymerase subunit M/transcription elongation factor TFIIS/ribosomal protein L40E